MKKIPHLTVITIALFLAACNGSPQTGGAKPDSGSHGSSGASDTTTQPNSVGSGAQSTSGSDTSHNNKGTDAPVADTAKKHRP